MHCPNWLYSGIMLLKQKNKYDMFFKLQVRRNINVPDMELIKIHYTGCFKKKYPLCFLGFVSFREPLSMNILLFHNLVARNITIGYDPGFYSTLRDAN